MNPLPLISAVIGIGSDWLAGVRERKAIKQIAEVEVTKAVTEAKIERVKTGDIADIEWASKAQDNSGWKDEWFTVLLSIPAVLCFIPGMDLYVTKGFDALQQTPDWYKAAFGVAVASAFGYRKIVGMIAAKNDKGVSVG